MKLVVTGGGESKHFHEIDTTFLSLLGKNPSLLYIPLAGDPKTFKYGLKRIRQTFSTIHFDNIEMCLDLEDLDWDYLIDFDAIYIDGGNTFTLMEEIRNTHFYELLHRFLHHNGVINGDSAGAIILGSHLETAHFGETPDENKTEVISYQGLNLLGSFAIHCHYKKRERKEVESFVKEFGFPVLAFHERSAATIIDMKIKVIGKKPVTVFHHKGIKVLEPGESLRIDRL